MSPIRELAIWGIMMFSIPSMVSGGLPTGDKSGQIDGAATIYTSPFVLESPGAYALNTGIRVKLKPRAEYRTVSLTTTLQRQNSSGTYENVSNFSMTVQQAGIENDSYNEDMYFPDQYTYARNTTGSTMIYSGIYRYKQFTHSTVGDDNYTVEYSSWLD